VLTFWRLTCRNTFLKIWIWKFVIFLFGFLDSLVVFQIQPRHLILCYFLLLGLHNFIQWFRFSRHYFTFLYL
jgi:hypothetical protein